MISHPRASPPFIGNGLAGRLRDLRDRWPDIPDQFQRSRFRTLKVGSLSLSFPDWARQITDERRPLSPFRLHINAQLQALLVEVTPLQPQRFRRIRDMSLAPLELSQQSRPLELRHPLR
jgi:hypothetical protein